MSTQGKAMHARPQRGAALLTALVIMGLVATLAAGMVWQQWRAVQVETAERARVNAFWVLSGALDWARLFVREDSKTHSDKDHLGEPWATGLAESRLSTFLAADKNNTDDAPDAFISGSISDEQARYNLRNLIGPGIVDPAELKAFKRLCSFAGVSEAVAETVAENLRQAVIVASAESASGMSVGQIAAATRAGGDADAIPPIGDNPPLLPVTVDQLVWLGLDAASLDKLRPLITILPEPTSVNLNTAPKEVIASVIDGMDLASAERLVQHRQNNPLSQVDDITKVLGPRAQPPAQAKLSVNTNYFSVFGRLRFEDRVIQQRYLLKRQGEQVLTLFEERLSGLEAGGAGLSGAR